MRAVERVASRSVTDHVPGVPPASLRSEDDPADGWFPESVAAAYDDEGGVDEFDEVEPVVQVLAELDAPPIEGRPCPDGTGRQDRTNRDGESSVRVAAKMGPLRLVAVQ